ncbi:MAG: cell division protein FtsX, partial [Planctomycetales bacterium]|nr:cell division protein FtsX [Planctomycetales bacterium]
AAMAFLAVFALVLTLAASRQASQWSNALAGSATVRIAATAADMEQQLAAVMTILSTTDGVEQVRVLDEDEQAALLTPWLGAGLPMDQLPIPQLVEVDLAPGGLDSLGLTLRLQAEAPDAVFDDHTR